MSFRDECEFNCSIEAPKYIFKVILSIAEYLASKSISLAMMLNRYTPEVD
jgi:hypothetical protein